MLSNFLFYKEIKFIFFKAFTDIFDNFKRGVSLFTANIKKYVWQNIQPSWIKKILMISSGSWIPVMIKFPYNHFNFAHWTAKRIHPESPVHLPLIKWISWYGNVFPERINCLFKPVRNMPWIKSVAVYHLKVLRGQMN